MTATFDRAPTQATPPVPTDAGLAPCDEPGGCACHILAEWRGLIAGADVPWLIRAATVLNTATELDDGAARDAMRDILIALRVRVGVSQ